MTLEQLQEETLITAISPLYPKSNNAIKELLPQPATTNRKTPYMPTIPFEPLYNIRDLYIKKNNLYKEYDISFGPIGASKEVTAGQMEMWAKNYIGTIHKADEKYIDLEECSVKKVLFRFNIGRWLRDNFDSTVSKFEAPASLCYEFKTPIPSFFKDNTGMVNGFICLNFLDYLSTRKSKLKNNKLRFLKDAEPSMFEAKIDNKLGYKGGIRCTLKQAIAFGALAIYSAAILHKNLTKEQIAMVNKTASRFADTSNLNRFLRNLK